MKNKTNNIRATHLVWRPNAKTVKSVLFIAFILASVQATLHAQESQFSKPSWWFGAAGGANFNFHDASIQRLNSDFTAPVAFNKSNDVGLYLAPLVEFHHPDSRWGIMLQAGYDNRKGLFEEQVSACNCPADLQTNLSYITVEPSLRFAPFKQGFYLYAGPRLAFNLDNSFTYKQGINPDFPDQVRTPDVDGDFGNANKTLISMQIGAGYDIPLSSQNSQIQSVISPFVSYQPYFGQEPRSTESWNLTTVRVGAVLKFGRGRDISVPPTAVVFTPEPEFKFTVNSPRNVPIERRVRETFPLLNYVFFNEGSTEIPNSYVMLRKDQVKDFKEDQLEVFAPKNLSGRSKRGMVVYYNVLNIIGDRMGKNPSTAIKLVGSSEKGPEDGNAMAESVKQYLVSIFGINASRISIEGRDKPKLPSEQPGATQDLGLLRAGDRRVSIESSSPALLMEFQSGTGASLRPVEIIGVQEAPIDSYVTFNVEGAREAFSSWSLEIRDEKGKLQSYGPFISEKVSMPGKFVLGTRPKGDYKVTMIGQTKDGKTIKKETTVNMVLWTPPENEQGMRYSVIFEFDESKAISIYEKYLTDIVTPKIPKDALVIVHGYTDIIGDEAYNQKLSLARANEVKNILASSLSKAGRGDIKFEVYGFGEDETLSPFENRFPEERFYNRTVIIDIIPSK